MQMLRPTLVVLISVLPGISILDAQRDDVVWDVRHTLTTADQQAILELAGKAGIRDPERVSEGIRSECALLGVESKPTVDGNRVTKSFVYVLQRSGPGCQLGAGRVAGREIDESGNWVVMHGPSNPTRLEYWRISDDAWHLDLALAPDIPYEVAQAVVLSLRQGTLVDRRPVGARWHRLRDIDPGSITQITRDKGVGGVIAAIAPVADGYEVRTGRTGGYVLMVTVRDDRVELHGVKDWIS